MTITGSQFIKDGKTHYERNKEYYKAKRAKQRVELREYIQKLKEVPCKDCGVEYPYYVMHFDHIGQDKEGTISRMVANGQTVKVKAEVAKCEVVCANCHAERTHQRHVDMA